MILTKSISRFARNTVTILETVRMLKALEVDVFFEEQNIHTMSADGELMLTILASYAQEESLAASENQKWRIKKNFEEGMPWNGRMLGYRMRDGQYYIMYNMPSLRARFTNITRITPVSVYRLDTTSKVGSLKKEKYQELLQKIKSYY